MNITSATPNNSLSQTITKFDDKTVALNKKIMNAAFAMMNSAHDLLQETHTLTISSQNNFSLLQENCQQMFDSALTAWSFSRQFCPDVDAEAETKITALAQAHSPTHARGHSPAFNLSPTPLLKTALPQPSSLLNDTNINEVEGKMFVELQGKGNEVGMDSHKVVKAGTKHLFVANVRTLIATVARSFNQSEELVNIGIASSVPFSSPFIKAFLQQMQAKDVVKIEISLIGGYEDTAATLEAAITKEIKAFPNAQIQHRLLNPYKVGGNYNDYERELDILGYILDVGITNLGQVFVHRRTLSNAYSLQDMIMLKFFLQKREQAIHTLVETLSKDVEKGAACSLFLKNIAESEHWVSEASKKNFLHSYEYFKKLMAQKNTTLAPQGK